MEKTVTEIQREYANELCFDTFDDLLFKSLETFTHEGHIWKIIQRVQLAQQQKIFSNLDRSDLEKSILSKSNLLDW